MNSDNDTDRTSKNDGGNRSLTPAPSDDRQLARAPDVDALRNRDVRRNSSRSSGRSETTLPENMGMISRHLLLISKPKSGWKISKLWIYVP